MKKLMILLAAATAVGFCGATDVWKDTPVDLGTYEMPASPNFYFMNGLNKNPYSVTLSQDATVNSIHPYGTCAHVTFDFSSGKTLTLSTCATIGSNIDVSFLGGTWALGGGAFYAAAETKNDGNIRETWDGVTVTCGHLGISQYSYDTFVTLTNGTTFTASKDCGLFCASPANETVPATNCWLYVTGGSKLIGSTTSSPIYTDYLYGGTHDVDSAWHVEVSGAGSEMSAAGYPMALCVGYKNRGITVRYSDHATGTFNNHVDVGSLAAARDNALIIDSGASVKVTDYVEIGRTEGADHNRVEVLDGGKLDVGQWSVVRVGNGSSFNEFMVSNATFVGKGIEIGTAATSSNNVVRLLGENTSLTLYGAATTFFGSGLNNRFVFGTGGSIGTFGTTDYSFINSDTGSSVGNVFEIMNGSTVNCDEFNVGNRLGKSAAGDHDNMLYVGSGSTLNMADRILLRGSGDSFVASNATVYSYNVYAGYEAGCIGSSVRLIGPDLVYSPRQGSFTFFGKGRESEFVMDGTCLGSSGIAANFSDAWAGWSTNNTLKIVNGANFKASTVYIGHPYGGGRGDKGNTLFVGSGSTLDVSGIDVTGVDNKVVVSNATVICSAGSPLILGDSSSGIAIDISGNELVLQGEDVCFKGTNETRNVVTVRRGGKVRFELSGDGYRQVPLQATVDLGADSQVSISISDEMRANLSPRHRDYRLTGTLTLSEGLTAETLLANVNAGMPKGCYAYLKENRLWVHVKNSNDIGMSLILR